MLYIELLKAPYDDKNKHGNLNWNDYQMCSLAKKQIVTIFR